MIILCHFCPENAKLSEQTVYLCAQIIHLSELILFQLSSPPPQNTSLLIPAKKAFCGLKLQKLLHSN